MRVNKVSWWDKLPLWEKWIFGSVVLLPLATIGLCAFLWTLSFLSTKTYATTLCTFYLLILFFGYVLIFLNHRNGLGVGFTPKPPPEIGKDFLLSSRAEYLGGHPLLSKIQVVTLGLTSEQVVVVAQEGTATIPIEGIADVEVNTEKNSSLVGSIAASAVTFAIPRILLPDVSKTESSLIIHYADETEITNRVMFGYIAPPNTHLMWRNAIVSTRYKRYKALT